MSPLHATARVLLLVPLLVLVAGAPAQPPPAKGKAPPGKSKEEEDPNAKAPTKRIRDDVANAPVAPEGPAPQLEPGVLVVAVRELPNLMSPALARSDAEKWALDLLFEGLLRRAADAGAGQHYEPALARELPKIVPLGRAFKLADARWTDGDGTDQGPVTAEDVRGTWDKLYKRRGQPGAELAEQIESVFVPGQQECRLIFRRGLLDPLAPATFKVLPSGRQEDELFAQHPVGTGPFVYAGRDTQQGRHYAVFKANPAYGHRNGRANRPILKEVRLLASRDPVADFRNHSVHLVLSPVTGEIARIRTATPEEKDTPARLEATVAGGLPVQTLPSRRIYYLAVNHTNPYLGGEAGKSVRHVIGYAIVRDKILADCFRAGYSAHHQPLNGPFPPDTWPCSPLVVKTVLDDPPAAITARDSAVFRAATGGKERDFELKYPSGDPAVENACRMIAEQIAEVKAGITIKPVAVPPYDLRRQIEFNTDYQLAFRHFDYADDWFNPAGLLDPTVPPGSGSRNFLGYKPSAEFGRLLSDCQDRRDFGELRKSMQRLHAAFAEEMPFIPLWHLDTHVLISQFLETRPAANRLDPLAPFVHIDEWRIRESRPAR